MLADMERRADKRTPDLRPVHQGGVRTGNVDRSTVDAVTVEGGGKTIGDSASLPFAGGKEHRNFAAEEFSGGSHAHCMGKLHASAEACSVEHLLEASDFSHTDVRDRTRSVGKITRADFVYPAVATVGMGAGRSERPMVRNDSPATTQSTPAVQKAI